MVKEKEGSSLPGVSITGGAYLNSTLGFYLQGFTTQIKHARYLQVKKAKYYGLELVSRFEKVDQALLSLKKIAERNTLTTNTFIYQVTTGSIIYGKLYITYQRFDEDDTNITYNYRYRDKSKTFFEENPNIDVRIKTGENQEAKHMRSMNKKVGDDPTRFKNHKYVRIRNKQETLRRRFKEI